MKCQPLALEVFCFHLRESSRAGCGSVHCEVTERSKKKKKTVYLQNLLNENIKKWMWLLMYLLFGLRTTLLSHVLSILSGNTPVAWQVWRQKTVMAKRLSKRQSTNLNVYNLPDPCPFCWIRCPLPTNSMNVLSVKSTLLFKTLVVQCSTRANT